MSDCNGSLRRLAIYTETKRIDVKYNLLICIVGLFIFKCIREVLISGLDEGLDFTETVISRLRSAI
jgi:hypothetical protein